MTLSRIAVVVLLAILLGFSVLGAQDKPAANTPSAAPATLPSVPPLSGRLAKPIELFNGKDLEGWTWFQPPPADGSAPEKLADVWTVRDGLLHDRGTPTGYIHTQTEFDNYVLTVEQRHVNKGNGGILIAMTGPGKIWPHCLECQTQNNEEGDLRGIANFKLNLDPARAETKRLRRLNAALEKPVGQWETFTITVDHGNIVVTQNGELQNITSTKESLAGQIGLQAEGGEMEFRKIELTPIGN